MPSRVSNPQQQQGSGATRAVGLWASPSSHPEVPVDMTIAALRVRSLAAGQRHRPLAQACKHLRLDRVALLRRDQRADRRGELRTRNGRRSGAIEKRRQQTSAQETDVSSSSRKDAEEWTRYHL